jgi:hypothetical protein
MVKLGRFLLMTAVVFAAALPGLAQNDSTEALAKAAQNPVANMSSLPLLLNATFDYGLEGQPKRDTQYVLNIQPVVPFTLNDKWIVITRTILPVVGQPLPFGDGSPVGGIANLQETLFFSPAKPGRIIWGVGPVVQFPTASNHVLGSSKWSGGPSFVVLAMPGNWVFGVLAQNVWSFAGPNNAPKVNQFLLQYFINYNFKGGWYVTSAPINTADWTQAQNKDKWTVPVGIGVGKIMRWGKQPVNMQLHYYYNVVRPTGAVPSGPYTVRFFLQFMFPRKK